MRSRQRTFVRRQSRKASKQAEFLLFGWFPWRLVERIGAADRETERQAKKVLEGAAHEPVVKVETSWYY